MTGPNLKGQLDIIERQLRSRAPADIRTAHDKLALLERSLEKNVDYHEKARLYLMLGVSLVKSTASLRMKPKESPVRTLKTALDYLESAFNLSQTASKNAPDAQMRTKALQLKRLCAYEWSAAYLTLRASNKLDDSIAQPPIKDMERDQQTRYKQAHEEMMSLPSSF